MEITAKTKQLGIIGDPVSHSFSPVMHNFISNYIGNDTVYSAFDVKPGELKDAISGIKALGIRGLNVTAPHKIEVMQYLDEISDDALRLGSVNTVVNKDGYLIGYNTDSDGFYLSLKNAGISVADSNVLVLGCGGVIIPMLAAIIKDSPKSITLLNRTKEKAVAVSDKIHSLFGYEISNSFEDIYYDIVINTTSAGMEHQIDVLPWETISEIKNTHFLKNIKTAIDLIYNPECTKFLKIAKENGAKILNGLDMLIYQGIIAYELFCDIKLPDNIAELIRKEVFGV